MLDISGGCLVTQATLKETWKRVQNRLEEVVGESSYRMFFKNTLVIQLTPERLEVGVPNSMIADFLNEQYLIPITDAVEAEMGFRPKGVNFSINGHLFRQMRQSQHDADVALAGVPDKRVPLKPDSEAPSTEGDDGGNGGPPSPSRNGHGGHQVFHINDRFRLDGVVVGNANRVAFKAAVDVAANPGVQYNPLFLYGGCGLGKTHLMQGIAHELDQRDGFRALYVTAEYFVNQFTGARAGRKFEDFRKRFRSLDALILDEADFLVGKDKCQEELLHTIDALIAAGKQVVISGGKHPKELSGFGEGLRSRLMQGMVAEIAAPDAQTRLSIIKAKVAKYRDLFPDATLNYLAKELDCNIRELEGSLTQLIAFAGMTREPITVPVVQTALKDFLKHNNRMVELSDIENIVISFYAVSSEDLHGRSRQRKIATARQVCMYLARNLTQHSLKEIGRFFGNKNHSTVVFATQKIESSMSDEAELKATIDHLVAQLRSSR